MMLEHEPIAIVGIGCRFPGGIQNPETFWKLLVDGSDAITEVPPDRFDIDAYYAPEPGTPGKVVTRYGGFLESVDRFDPDFFGIAPVEAERMDPQQRLLLEVSWEAFEDAGIPPSRLSGTETGVFIGSWLQDFESRLVGNPSVDDIRDIDLYATTGSGRYALAGRLSFYYGLQGPSLVVDTHCSSSLVAIHLACQSLWTKESEIAIAGGVNVILTPYITAAYSQSGIIAPDGRCKFGDAKANGYVRSEGCGLVVLKPHSRAMEDGDDIYAVILGGAVNNDGSSSGFLTTPGQTGQQDVLRKAYRRAGISPGMVNYVEAHGTGTPTGDPIELNALGAVLNDGRAEGSTCWVGSIKTNFGHTEGAAGVAGLIKLALALKNKEIPASLHFQEPNTQIPWDSIRLRVNREKVSWPSHEGLRFGGVSSFGITGTNAHIVMQNAPAFSISGPGDDEQYEGMIRGKYLFPVSAQSPEALRDKVISIAQWMKQSEDTNGLDSIEDLCAVAAHKRDHLDYRMAYVAEDLNELQKSLLVSLKEKELSGPDFHLERISSQPKIVFVFPGQGSQYPGMCQKLMLEPTAFKKTIEQCDVALKPFCDWSLLDLLHADSKSSRQDDIDVIQPALFSIQVALAAQWIAWGVEPDAVVGHSMGEAAAAHISGALSLEEAAQVITKRSQLMKTTSGRGAMALVELTADQALAEIAGREKQLSIAVSNSPRSTVLSGDPAALDAVLKGLENRDIFCRKIKVDVASHSPQMEPLRTELVAALRRLRPKPAVVPMYSTVTGAVQGGQYFDADYWGANLRSPVRFAVTVSRLLESNHTVFLEMSPHPLLLRAIDETFMHQYPEADVMCLSLPSLVRNEDDRVTLLSSLGRVYASGYPVQWQAMYPQPRSSIKLPRYPWQRKRYWFNETVVAGKGHRPQPRILENVASDKSDTPDAGVHSAKGKLKPAQSTLRESLKSAKQGNPRYLIWEGFLKEQLSTTLSVPASRVDTTKAFKAYGMDSLRALQYRSLIENALKLELSSTLVWNYPTIKKLARYLADSIELDPETPQNQGGTKQNETPAGPELTGADDRTLGALLEEIESLSAEEARKLLDDEC